MSATDPSQRSRIVVVGHLSTDLVALLSGPAVAGSDTTAAVRVTGGGQAANTASWLAWLEHPVTLVGCVGDDQYGRDRLDELTRAGVSCAVRRCPDAATGTVLVLSHDGERTMVSDRGANLLLGVEDIDRALEAAADAAHLHLSGYLLLDEATRAVGRHALAAARSKGLSVSVDAVSAQSIRDAGPAGCLDWIGGIELLLANAEEATALTGQPSPELAVAQLADVVGQAVVKLGAGGAIAAGPGGQRVLVPGRPARVVDPTGAGDAFAAGLLTAWTSGEPIEPALGRAVEVGTRAVGLLGARPAAR